MFIGLLSVCKIVLLYRRVGESLISNSKRPIKCVFLNNHSCHARPTLVNINSVETLF